jgi:hypothetical protein
MRISLTTEVPGFCSGIDLIGDVLAAIGDGTEKRFADPPDRIRRWRAAYEK